MGKKLAYKKDSLNMVVEVSNSENGEVLFKIPNKNAVNINEIFSDYHMNSIMNKNYSDNELPKSITVMAYSVFDLI